MDIRSKTNRSFGAVGHRAILPNLIAKNDTRLPEIFKDDSSENLLVHRTTWLGPILMTLKYLRSHEGLLQYANN